LNELGTDGKLFTAFSIEDRVVPLKLGECGVIITRKIACGIILALITLLVIVYKVNTYTAD